MQERRQPETLRLRSLMPSLTVNDLAASVAWYRDVSGSTPSPGQWVPRRSPWDPS